jgi:hypothetical protein
MVNATMYVGIVEAIHIIYTLDDTLRFLGGSTTIQIDEWLAVNLGAQNGKIAAYGLDVKHIITAQV